MPQERFRITMLSELLQQISARSSASPQERNMILNRDLTRYYFLLDRARIRLRELFDAAEAAAICAACRHYQAQHGAWEPWTIPLLHRHVMAAIEEQNLDRRWHVDGHALVLKLRALDHLALFALLDAVERFWAHPAETPDPDGSTRLDFRTVFADPQPAPATPHGSSLAGLADIWDEFPPDEEL